MHVGLILVSVPLAFELSFVYELSQLLNQVEVERQKESEARELQSGVNRVLKLLITLGGRMGAYAFTRGGQYLVQYRTSQADLINQMNRLEQLTANKPEAHASMQKIHNTVMDSLDEFRDIKHLVSQGDQSDAVRNLRNMRELVRAVSIDADGILNPTENILRIQAANEATYRAKITSLLWYFIYFNIFVALALAYYFTRKTTKRLKVLMENTSRLAKGDPLVPPVSGGDEIAELDDTFRKMATALAESEAHKQELIAIVSHDLRSPLTSVRGVLSLIGTGMYGELNEAGQEKLKVADRGIGTLINLINDLLDIEKMKAGKLEINLAPISISDVANRAAEAVRDLGEQRKVSINVQESQAQALADKDRLMQVMLNLLSNAIKFSPDDSTITVTIAEIDSLVEVRVQDQGPGIPEKYKDTIFDSYEQVDEPEAKEKGGTGLGLTICRAIIQQHGGTIGVESEDGKGATFWFRLAKV